MCGHVGIAGALELKDEACMKRMLVYDFFRGPDSTGFASFRINGDVKIAKIASHPLDLFDTKRFTECLIGASSKVFLGHNRAATKGAINAVNAHPYQYDHIIGAHNGTLETSSWTKLKEMCGEETGTDSQAIFLAISKFGIEKVVPVLQGAWALVWFDLEENTLNFLRNDERSFWYAYEEGFKKVFWASEHPMLRASIESSTVPYKMYTTEKNHRFFSTKIDTWYRFDLAKLRLGSETRPDPMVKELKGMPPVPTTNYNCSNYSNGTYVPFRDKPKTSTTKSHGGGSAETPPKIINLTGSKEHPLGGIVTKEQFDKIANYGCSYCGTDVEFEDVGVTLYVDRQAVLCPSCSGNDDHSRVYRLAVA